MVASSLLRGSAFWHRRQPTPRSEQGFERPNSRGSIRMMARCRWWQLSIARRQPCRGHLPPLRCPRPWGACVPSVASTGGQRRPTRSCTGLPGVAPTPMKPVASGSLEPSEIWSAGHLQIGTPVFDPIGGSETFRLFTSVGKLRLSNHAIRCMPLSPAAAALGAG